MIALGIIVILISLPLMFIPIFGIPLFIVGVVMIFSAMGKKNSKNTAKAIAEALKEHDEKKS